MTYVNRRSVLKAGAALATSALAMPPLLSYGRGEKAVKIGMIDPVTAVYAAEGDSEISGARMALDEVNRSGGITGREVELIIEDSAANAGLAQQKAYKLMDRDQVDMLMGAVSSAVALSVNQAAHDRGKLYMVKVTPPHGVPYYLVDPGGDGNGTEDQQDLAAEDRQPAR